MATTFLVVPQPQAVRRGGGHPGHRTTRPSSRSSFRRAWRNAAFRAPDYPGPDGYAREKHPDLQPGDEEYEQDRNAAYLVVGEVVGILKEQLW